MPNTPDTHMDAFVCLTAGTTSLVLDCTKGARPAILYWGHRLEGASPELLKTLTTRQHAPGSADAEITASLLNETGTGMSGQSGFMGHRSGTSWASLFVVERVERPSDQSVSIICFDPNTQIRAVHEIGLAPESQVITCQTRIENAGQTDLSIDWCAATCLPLDARATRLLGFTGRWAGEFQVEDVPHFTGAYLRENKTGRTSHDSFPGLIAAADKTDEHAGDAYGFHLGWSGNHRLRVDRLPDGRSFLQMGEYLHPGECILKPTEMYQTPVLYAAYSPHGLSGLSNQFHTHLRRSLMDERIRKKPRPVHYNTWEAVYFNHRTSKLLELAETAAEVGAERFVLDDGWFGSRRNDKTGLGDWQVSKEVYPDGLKPLIDKVTSLGMEFGIWFEPEMVNPDSDLFRAHPDWILQAEGVEQIPFRGQVALNLTRTEVTDYLYRAISNMLDEYDISYIKWDMNRDIHHPGSNGRPLAGQQVRALYTLIQRIRKAYPDLEIESCASGGGRADFAILHHTDRIWTSDSNDALDRQRIQRGASHFFPLEALGTHVGPETCHITGRRLTMQMRVASAFFGHMGMEMNLLKETSENLAILKAGIALHKQHRALLHSGKLLRLDTPRHFNAMGIVSDDQTEALFSWANLTGHRETLPGRLYPPGIDPSRNYSVQIIWPHPVSSVSSPSIVDRADLGGAGIVVPGDALMRVGIQLPLLHPETCLIYHLKAV